MTRYCKRYFISEVEKYDKQEGKNHTSEGSLFIFQMKSSVT